MSVALGCGFFQVGVYRTYRDANASTNTITVTPAFFPDFRDGDSLGAGILRDVVARFLLLEDGFGGELGVFVDSRLTSTLLQMCSTWVLVEKCSPSR